MSNQSFQEAKLEEIKKKFDQKIYRDQVYRIIVDKYQTKKEIVSKYELVRVETFTNPDGTYITLSSLGEKKAMYTIPFFSKYKYFQSIYGTSLGEKMDMDFESMEDLIKYAYDVPDIRYVTHYDILWHESKDNEYQYVKQPI
jgi:hypothetical protein